jgi:chloramphenicol O-acetyltransferase
MKHIKLFEQFVNEVKAVSAQNKSFDVKGIRLTYTEQRGRFYGAYLYDVPKTSNVSHKAKFGLDEINDFLKSIGINDEVPFTYETKELDAICKQLKKKGIVCDHDDAMDIS